MTVASKAETFATFADHVSSGKAAFFQSAGIDFVFGRREGPYMWDLDGQKRLINCHCNGGVFNLGHRHPAVVEALTKALEQLDIGNHHLVSQQRADLAARLAELSPGRALDYTVFGVGGGEAIDLAFKIARGVTGRQNILSARGGYHGHTGLAMAAGDERYYAPFGKQLPGFQQIPFDDLPALEAAVDDQSAAVIFETIPATSGMPIPVNDFFARAREICDRQGALLIFDEVQTGLGRTGRLWAVEHFGVIPDIMVSGKGLSGGIYPISATSFRAEYERIFQPDPFIHVSTFGGSEVGCLVAMKVLEISADPAFLAHVNEMAAIFRDGFAQLKLSHPSLLVGLRQLGLMMGIEMVHEVNGPLFTKAAYDNGLLSIFANNDPRIAQLLPPLTIDRPLVEEILQRVDRALGQVGVMMERMGTEGNL
jgi:acetylornithine/succinyldiaminopimelate/putrescine aminotransferase